MHGFGVGKTCIIYGLRSFFLSSNKGTRRDAEWLCVETSARVDADRQVGGKEMQAPQCPPTNVTLKISIPPQPHTLTHTMSNVSCNVLCFTLLA